MFFRFLHFFVLLTGVFGLTACAYIMDDSIQDLTVVTPGAEDAVCHVYVEKLHYRFKPPQTISIHKSKQDLIVDCFAPGNRHQKQIIKATYEGSAGYNALNGVIPGLTWDYASAALFKYPSTITVDFTHAPILPEDMPDQNNPDTRQPEEYQLEEFGPSQPRMNSDSAEAPVELKRRAAPMIVEESTYTETYQAPPTAPASDKGDLMPAQPSDAAPVPLIYPGQ